MGVGRTVMWGLMGATTTKVARKATRRAMHDDWGDPRLPERARVRDGLATALMWAAATGIVLAMADVLKEQRSIVKERTA
jgi:hypothetical protein